MASPRRVALYPGTFDPVTNGHLDIIQRAGQMFDEIIVAVSRNPPKKPLFAMKERVSMLRKAIESKGLGSAVSVEPFEGLTVHFAQQKKAVAVVRGLRAISDFEYEFQMALMNRHQAPNLETVFLMPDEKYSYLSSSLLKEIVRLGGQVDRFVPKMLIPTIRKKLSS